MATNCGMLGVQDVWLPLVQSDWHWESLRIPAFLQMVHSFVHYNVASRLLVNEARRDFPNCFRLLIDCCPAGVITQAYQTELIPLPVSDAKSTAFTYVSAFCRLWRDCGIGDNDSFWERDNAILLTDVFLEVGMIVRWARSQNCPRHQGLQNVLSQFYDVGFKKIKLL